MTNATASVVMTDTNVINLEKPYQWIRQVYASTLPAQAKLLASVLCSYMNDKRNFAFPSLRTLAKQSSLALSTCQKYITKLESLGYLRIKRRAKSNGTNRQFYNVYTINLPPIKQPERIPDSEGVPSDDTRCTERRYTVYRAPVRNKQLNNQLNNQCIRKQTKEKSTGNCYSDNVTNQDDTFFLKPSTDDILTHEKQKQQRNKHNNQNRFNELWEHYPKKASKQKALQAFYRLNPSDDLFRTILKAIEDTTRLRWQHIDKNFIPSLSVYLNQERWTDEIIPAVDKHQVISAGDKVRAYNKRQEEIERQQAEQIIIDVR